jgi:hypothetical protein
VPYTALGTPQTAWARHLDNIRRERKWSATALFEDCHEALGLGPKSLTSFKGVLKDKPMPAEWAAALTKRYGAPAADLEPASTPRVLHPVEERIAQAILAQAESNDRIAAAMTAQAQAFTVLAKSIDAASKGVTGRVADFDGLLRDMLVALGAQASAAPDGTGSGLRAGR